MSAVAIDIHTHISVPEVRALVADHPDAIAEQETTNRLEGGDSVATNKNMIAAVMPKLLKPEIRLHDMDQMGVKRQAISVSPAQYYTWAERELASVIVEKINARISEWQDTYPDRMTGLATVSLQHPDLAVAQLEYAREKLGLKGVQIPTALPGRELSHDSLIPFWDAADALNMLVVIHPFGCQCGGDRLSQYYLQNSIGQPLETTIALSHLIFSRRIDNYPKAKIMAVHGGGYLPAYAGRTMHASAVRSEAHLPVSTARELLGRFYFDSLVFLPGELRNLVSTVGADRVAMGSDYPYDMSCEDPVGHVVSAGLDTQETEAILFKTAERLLGD